MPNSPGVKPPPPREEKDEKSNVVFGDTIVEEDGKRQVNWSWATLGNEEVDPGTQDTLLLKSQADSLYGSLSGGTLGYLELDATGGAVTEKLPPPSVGAVVTVIRVDATANTAKIEDRGGNDIVWPGRGQSTTFRIPPEYSVVLSSNGSYWTVENPAVYEIESFIPGSQIADSYVLRHAARHRVRTVDLRVDAEQAPASDHDLNVDVLHPNDTTTPIGSSPFTVPSGTKRITFAFEQLLEVDDVLRVKTDPAGGNYSADILDTCLNIDVGRA